LEYNAWISQTIAYSLEVLI